MKRLPTWELSMSTLPRNQRLSAATLDFVWRQWSQLGISHSTTERDPWAQDPEALLIFSLPIARADPRLFDELLDWLRLNGRLMSARRLSTLLPPDDSERRLVQAAVAWGEAHATPPRTATTTRKAGGSPEPVFPGIRVSTPDPIFLAHGFSKPQSAPSGKSISPELSTPIGLAFSLRELFGLASSRAEIIRFLLTTDQRVSRAATIADAAGYTKRNVNETLSALAAAGLVERTAQGNSAAYSLDRERWLTFLERETCPLDRAWPSIYRALSAITQWQVATADKELSAYLQASGEYDVIQTIRNDAETAGIRVRSTRRAADAAGDLDQITNELLALLSTVPEHVSGAEGSRARR